MKIFLKSERPCPCFSTICQWDWLCNHFLDGLVPNFVQFLGPLPLLFHSRNWVHHLHLGKNNNLQLFSFRANNRHGNTHLLLIMCHVWGKVLNRLLPSFISACKPCGVLQSFKIPLIIILLIQF